MGGNPAFSTAKPTNCSPVRNFLEGKKDCCQPINKTGQEQKADRSRDRRKGGTYNNKRNSQLNKLKANGLRKQSELLQAVCSKKIKRLEI